MKVFDKAIITRLVRYLPKSARFPFSEYSYSVWYFDDGSKVVLTNLLIETAALKRKIAGKPHDEEIFEHFPFVKYTTHLN